MDIIQPVAEKNVNSKITENQYFQQILTSYALKNLMQRSKTNNSMLISFSRPNEIWNEKSKTVVF